VAASAVAIAVRVASPAGNSDLHPTSNGAAVSPRFFFYGILIVMTSVSSVLLMAAVVVGTWNGKWFPSGDSEHRAPSEVEARTIAAAGRLLAHGLAAVDPAGTNDVILCLNEIRGPRSARALATAIGRTNLTLAVISGYRRRDRFDMQQDVILTTLPVVRRNWSVWKSEKGIRPPRGYAHAELVVAPAVTASVYAVHLKSNYGASSPRVREENRAKRQSSVRQLLELTKVKRGAAVQPVVIGGDFNADPSRPEFVHETFPDDFADAAYLNLLSLLPPAARATYPNARHGDSTLDYLFVRDFESVASPCVVPAGDLSDHNPVFALLRIRSE